MLDFEVFKSKSAKGKRHRETGCLQHHDYGDCSVATFLRTLRIPIHVYLMLYNQRRSWNTTFVSGLRGCECES
jgi:hypothetical protein